MWGCTLTRSGSPGFPQVEPPPWQSWTGHNDPTADGYWAREGFWGIFLAAVQTICLGTLPVSPLLGTGCQLLSFPFKEQEDGPGWAEEPQDQVRSPVCTPQTSLLSTECYLGILLICSNVCLLSRTLCVGQCLFGTSYRSSSQGICDSSVFWCVSIPFVWSVFLLPSVKR